MKICVIGGNGQVGQRCCRLGIGKGHTMTALVRDPNKISSELRALINIVQGDATDVKDVDLAVQGQDSVLCCLGGQSMSEGLCNVLESMRRFAVPRISVCLSSFLLWDQSKLPAFAIKAVDQHNKMWQSLKDLDSSIQWTAVLPPGFTDEPLSGGKYLVKYDVLIGRRISKEDLADFMLDCLSMKEHENKSCSVSNSTEYLEAA